ncbi:MAG: EAL domain-containing protein [Pseudomonadota bacterium]
MSRSRDWSDALPPLFAAIGETRGYDRVALFRAHEAEDAGLAVSCHSDWARPGLASLERTVHPSVQPAAADETQRDWATRRARGEMIEGVGDALAGYLGEYFRTHGIRRFLTIPVMVEGYWWGHLAVSLPDPAHDWTEAERAMLQVVARVVGQFEAWSRGEQQVSKAARDAMITVALDGIVSINEAGQIIEFNPAAEQMFGFDRDAVLGRSLGETIIPPVHQDTHARGLTSFLAGGAPRLLGRRVETEARRANGEVFPVELTITEIRAGGRRFFTAYLRDISDRAASQAALERLAFVDQVTGLPNRAGLLRQFHLPSGVTCGAVVLQIPNLSLLSASLGDVFVEPILIGLARRLESLMPQGAHLARTGESEFAAVVPCLDEMHRIGSLISQAIQAPIETEGRHFYVQGKIGIAKGSGNVDALLRDAELASRWEGFGARMFSESLRLHHQDQLDLETELREVLLQQSDALFPMFQPLCDVASGAVVGFEALARWRHPRRDMIPPSEFIPLAEAAGLADQLGEAMLERAARACVTWNTHRRARGLAERYVSVNLSAMQLSAPDLVSRITRVLDRAGLPGSQVRFELTETAILTHPLLANRILQDLRNMGCGIAIDDFGTGYSSLAYLRRLPADAIKMDRSFILGLDSDQRSRRIVHVLVDLAHTLDMTVVAEGVETSAAMNEIRAAGCDFAQGFFLGRPMSAVDATALDDPPLQ